MAARNHLNYLISRGYVGLRVDPKDLRQKRVYPENKTLYKLQDILEKLEANHFRPQATKDSP